MFWHALAPLCPVGELQTAMEGTRPVAFVLGFGLFCTNSQGRDPSTRRGAGPTAAILALALWATFRVFRWWHGGAMSLA